MEKKPDPKEHEDLLNEVDREFDKAMTTPGGLQKYMDDLEEFYNNTPEGDLNEALDSVEYNAISAMLKWSEEDIKSKLSEAPSSVLREYVRFINLNKNIQEGNSKKITLLFQLLKESEKNIKKRPRDINQVFLCGWIAKDSSKYTKSETNYGCKFTVR
jgi:site-specific recombinase XerD